MGILSHLTVLLAAVYPLVASEAATPTPKITSITYSGSGCASDPKLAGDFNDPTFTYQDFSLTLSSVESRTANCQVHLQASGGGAGWQVALTRNVVKGHVYLTPGDTLNYYTTVYFSQDAANTATYKGAISNSGSGTINQGVTLISRSGDDDKVWSPCTGSSGYTGILNVNFRGALVGDGKSYFEAFTENWDLEWRRC